MKRFVFLLCLSLPICVFAEGGLPDKPYIYVEGNAEIQKPADFVTFRFDLVARALEQPKANKIFPLLKDLKIADTDVIAEDLRSEPEFEEGPEYSTKRGNFIGYKVTRPFKVKVRDVTVFPKLADELIGGGDVEFSAVDGGFSKEKETEDQIGEKALTNARERAEKMLKSMGMKIDSVFAVSPVPFPEIETRIFGETDRVIVTASNIPSAAEERSSEYKLAPVTVRQSVHVIYLISPAK
jgi:uncharacterized protein YggE